MNSSHPPLVALITGSAKRIGAIIATTLHAKGYNVIIHYRQSVTEAEELAAKLNAQRSHSAITLQADFNDFASIKHLAQASLQAWQRLDLLVNNASDYFAAPFAETDIAAWQTLHNSNIMGPYFLTQALLPTLRESGGNVINILDAQLQNPPAGYSAYCIAKAGLQMMTRCLAQELGPEVRINAIAPGKTLWANDKTPADAEAQLARIALKKQVNPQDIADAVLFLAQHQSMTGSTITIDCGYAL